MHFVKQGKLERQKLAIEWIRRGEEEDEFSVVSTELTFVFTLPPPLKLLNVLFHRNRQRSSMKIDNHIDVAVVVAMMMIIIKRCFFCSACFVKHFFFVYETLQLLLDFQIDIFTFYNQRSYKANREYDDKKSYNVVAQRGRINFPKALLQK